MVDNFLATTGHGIARAEYVATTQWSVEFLLLDQDVRCLAADPLNPEVVYAGTQGNGVLRSRDRGKTWRPCGLSRQVVKALAMSRAAQSGWRSDMDGPPKRCLTGLPLADLPCLRWRLGLRSWRNWCRRGGEPDRWRQMDAARRGSPPALWMGRCRRSRAADALVCLGGFQRAQSAP